MKNFNEIKTRNELADYLGVSRRQLSYLLYKQDRTAYYKVFAIPKKNNDIRTIRAPIGSLKSIQKKLAQALYKYQIYYRRKDKIKTNISHGFEKNKSIMTNAKVHRNKKIVINLDLSDFFNSFHFGRIMGFFEKNRHFCMTHEVAVIIANISCFDGVLPQGSPCSPIITNLICEILDMRILKIAKSFKLDYTRYADDLSFSTNNNDFINKIDLFKTILSQEIERAGFTINDNKTRVIYKNSSQRVTGLVVNKKVNFVRSFYKNSRAMAHSLYKNGSFYINGNPGTIKQLIGRFSFIIQVNQYNNQQRKIKHIPYINLNAYEKEYSKLLFYSIFYINEFPTIITEGKTDVMYIKAALKKMYLDYPRLINKDEEGKFRFKINFLKKTDIGKVYFNIEKDGAQGLINFINNCIDTKDNRYFNYYKYFKTLTNQLAKKPTILLFDNEKSDSKPLSNLINRMKFSTSELDLLKEKYYLRITKDNCLFIMTVPYSGNKEDFEIEDLFTEETLQHTINGKEFSREVNCGNNNCYGKEVFASYVLSNYESINFDKFKQLLDNILAIDNESASVSNTQVKC